MAHFEPTEQVPGGHRKCDDVECHADRLAQKKGDANGASNRQAKGAADHVIRPSPFYFLVGRDLGHGKGCGDGHQMPQNDDDHGPEQTHVGYGKPKAQKQYGTENGRDGRHENGKRPKSLFLHAVKIVFGAFVSVTEGFIGAISFHEFPTILAA